MCTKQKENILIKKKLKKAFKGKKSRKQELHTFEDVSESKKSTQSLNDSATPSKRDDK